MRKALLIFFILIFSLLLISCGECEHQWSDATCAAPKTCALCGVTEGAASGHSFGEWSVTKEPTCAEDGSKSRACICGETETEKIAASHDLTSHEEKPATCSAAGYKAYESCSRCDYTTFEEIPALPHDTVEHLGKFSTCTEVGHDPYVTCKNCSYTTYKAKPLLPHHTVEHLGKFSTCTEVGHDPYVTCKNCSYTTYKAKPLLPHHTVEHDGKPASCTEIGYKPYVTCKNCSYTTYEEIPMEKHDYNSVTVPPTCTGEGYVTYTCKNCPHSYVEKIPPHGHTWGEWFISEEITSESNGQMRRNCVNCDGFETKPIGIVASGNIGATNPGDATYTIYEDGTFKLSGSGETASCGWNGASQPFKNYRSSVTRVIIAEGITKVGIGTFSYLPNLEYAYIPSTISVFPQNLFMDSFAKNVTSFTIPANITRIEICALGRYNQSNALFTDIIIENPNVTFQAANDNGGTPYIFVNAYASRCSELTIYSYGASNNVSKYAEQYGLRYVDLSTTVLGTVDNISYNCFEGVLTLNAKDASAPVALTAAPWLDRISKSDITEIVINAGIDSIPTGFFKDYTALTSVTLPKTLTTVGSEAFATSSGCSTALTLNLPDALTTLASDFLSGRSAVTVNGFKGTPLDSFSQSGVKLNLKKALKILLIGNSLSLDAADCLAANTPSQLYNIIKSMVGDDVYVQIGALYSGAKTAGWHATVAESNAEAYGFYVISDDTDGLWRGYSGYTSAMGLSYDTWDIVTIQPYASETSTGVGSTSDTDAKPEKTNPVKIQKFYPLSASLPYLLDHIDKYCSGAKVYYYLTWSSSQTPELNHNAAQYDKMLGVAKTALGYVGTESGKGFDGFIPFGTAIQNERSTYLVLQYYLTGNDS
ncbi:MAG: DUF4886 domain-containing protein [Clostridia bacterium]|nr:DUF4886 domain-containing protein [Clostridia bacterium]